MKLTSFYCAILLVFLSNSLLNAQQYLMPVPQRVNYGKTKFNLSNARVLISKDFPPAEKNAINQFVSSVKEHTGIALSTTYLKDARTPLFIFNSGHAGSALPVPNEKTDRESREAYQINVTDSKVVVTAKCDAGVFYALQTLQQLIHSEGKQYYIPEVDIYDYPAFAYRGVMMDFSHGGLLTEEEIKRQIDFLTRWKMNQYYFYNEVSIEMKGYPLLNYRAQYSQEQIKRIIAYAKDRYIDVIPFVEFYGHLHELVRLEKYADLGIGTYGHDLDPRNKAVQVILKDWINQYVQLFPTPFIHIGFDETWETKRLSIEKDTTITPKQLYLSHLDFVTKTLQGYGKTVMVWTDIARVYPDIISEFPKQIIPVVWEYSNNPNKISNAIKPVAKENLPFFIQSAVDQWGHVYTSDYSYDNIDMCLQAGHSQNAIGYITSVWTDAVQPLLRNTWMFMAYGCIGAWQTSPVERSEFINRYCRIVYPKVSEQLNTALKKMSESQSYLEKCLGENSRYTLVEMWDNPFSVYHLKNTNEHINDFKKARMAAELAEETLINALEYKTRDSAFIKTLIFNSRLLDYAATRFVWAKTIADRWNNAAEFKTKKDSSFVIFYDVAYTTHGLVTDMLDYSSELKEEYKESWLSENMPYRLGTMTMRFDAEYLLWKDLYSKILDYQHHNKKNEALQKFGEIYKVE